MHRAPPCSTSRENSLPANTGEARQGHAGQGGGSSRLRAGIRDSRSCQGQRAENGKGSSRGGHTAKRNEMATPGALWGRGWGRGFGGRFMVPPALGL